MAAPWRYRVTIYQSRIDALFLPGGDVWGWARRMGQETMAEAIQEAPSRTGELRALHGYNVTPAGKTQVRWTVWNDAQHARFVHEGTSGPITAASGGRLRIRPAPHSWSPVPLYPVAVRGQRANPWIQRASDSVLARHGIH